MFKYKQMIKDIQAAEAKAYLALKQYEHDNMPLDNFGDCQRWRMTNTTYIVLQSKWAGIDSIMNMLSIKVDATHPNRRLAAALCLKTALNRLSKYPKINPIKFEEITKE